MEGLATLGVAADSLQHRHVLWRGGEFRHWLRKYPSPLHTNRADSERPLFVFMAGRLVDPGTVREEPRQRSVFRIFSMFSHCSVRPGSTRPAPHTWRAVIMPASVAPETSQVRDSLARD